MGIPTNRVISYTFMLGSALAGAAGVLVGLIYPKIEPLMGVMPGLKAFVAAVLGGVLAVERRPQVTAALLVLALAVAWDTLFLAFDTLPATVPVAVALVLLEAADRRRVHGSPPRGKPAGRARGPS
jgi:branched-chain amino acid transport system permease protein